MGTRCWRYLRDWGTSFLGFGRICGKDAVDDGESGNGGAAVRVVGRGERTGDEPGRCVRAFVGWGVGSGEPDGWWRDLEARTAWAAGDVYLRALPVCEARRGGAGAD